MELVLNSNFREMQVDECIETNGGSITLATVLVTVLGYKVTVGACIKAGAILGVAASAIVALSN